eukprot:scaffold3348_cov113-Isochrysis_galbana.AAC.19
MTGAPAKTQYETNGQMWKGIRMLEYVLCMMDYGMEGRGEDERRSTGPGQAAAAKAYRRERARAHAHTPHTK